MPAPIVKTLLAALVQICGALGNARRGHRVLHAIDEVMADLEAWYGKNLQVRAGSVPTASLSITTA